MKLKLNKIKSTFDISIGQYQSYMKLQDPTDLQIVSIFYNIDIEAVKLISNKDLTKLVNDVKLALEAEHKHILKYKGLGFENDLEEMASGAFFDAILYAQDIQTAHLFTAVLYRPIKKDLWYYLRSKKYELKEYNGTKGLDNFAKDLPLALYLSCNTFFLTLRTDFLNAIQNRFQAESKQLKANSNKSDCKETGEMLCRFMQLLEEITISSSMLHPKSQLTK